MLNIVLLVAFYFAGLLLGSFGIIAPLIIIRTSNPLIRALNSKNLIRAKKAKARNRMTIILWIFIDVIAAVLVIAFTNSYAQVGFFIGIAFAVLTGWGKTGLTQSNRADFIKSYSAFFDIADADEVISTVMNYGG